MMVKICGITNRQDAVAAVDAGATALGFNFYRRSVRYIDPVAASQIANGLTVVKVGVFVNESPAEVARISALVKLDVVQFHGDEASDAVNQFEGRVWKAFRITDTWSTRMMEPYSVEAFLLDAPSAGSYGGSGEPFDWNRARGIGRKFILAGGLDASNVSAAIRELRPWGVDSCSRLESSPGRKDHGKMQRFIAAALAENL